MASFFRHAKFKAPMAHLRSRISALWRLVFAAIGLYRPLSARETAYVPEGAAPFYGDIPIRAGVEHCQRRLVFAEPPPAVERVENLVVTPAGAGWKGGRLYERYSAARPGLKMVLSGFGRKPSETLAKAYVIQSVHPATFGDWFGEYLAALANLPPLDAPLLLPASLYERSYAARDIKRLGLNAVPVTAPVRIEKAEVIRQRMMLRYWTKPQVDRLRAFLKADPPAPAPGSLLYLSRRGERSEIADRTHPHDMLEEVVRRRGGRVLRTCEASLDDYIAAGKEAETLLFDHGSAGYNMIYWRPRRVIEFVSDAWWMNAFLFFSNALGVRDYAIICTDRGGVDEIERRLEAALDRPIKQAAGDGPELELADDKDETGAPPPQKGWKRPIRRRMNDARIKAPIATLRSFVSGVWRAAYKAAGRYAPLTAAETELKSGDRVSFYGDVPVHAGKEPAQNRLSFALPRPIVEEVEGLVVTSRGHAWKDGVLYEKYSATKPGLRDFLAPSKPETVVPYAYVIQSEHIDTFGDWMSEYLAPLARLDAIDGPALLPASLARRPYVIRDAARLGVDFRPVERATKIERARVVRQRRVIRYWTKDETDSLKRFLRVAPTEPRPGSILYLSRCGEASEVAVRSHPHEALEKTVAEHGGRVLRTAEATLEDFIAAAEAAETVVMDHGSAGYNMIYWRPKKVVEIVSDAWWLNAFLFFADALGVRDYTIIRSDDGDPASVAAKLAEALDRPVRT